MKLAIVSTTIHAEDGYLPFDHLASASQFSEVAFFIAGDKKSPPFDTSRFRCRVEYLDVAAQGRFACSEPMGWNKIMRRNTALLRALETDPDAILMIDDDNIPSPSFFDAWHRVLSTPAAVEAIGDPQSGEGGSWFNYLRTTDAAVEIYPRGFPIRFRGAPPPRLESVAPIPNTAIGLYQGISLGDCDIDAMTRIVYPNPVTAIAEKNYCVRHLWSPYNTQNTVFRPCLFDVAFVWPFCGRYDDIYSSFVWQRLLFQNNLYVHVGDAVNHQERGKRDIFRELRDEVEGYFNAHLVWGAINEIQTTDPIIFLEELAKSENEIIQRQATFVKAYLQDLKAIRQRRMVGTLPTHRHERRSQQNSGASTTGCPVAG